METTAQTKVLINEVIAARWSPRAFDEEHAALEVSERIRLPLNNNFFIGNWGNGIDQT